MKDRAGLDEIPSLFDKRVERTDHVNGSADYLKFSSSSSFPTAFHLLLLRVRFQFRVTFPAIKCRRKEGGIPDNRGTMN